MPNLNHFGYSFNLTIINITMIAGLCDLCDVVMRQIYK